MYLYYIWLQRQAVKKWSSKNFKFFNTFKYSFVISFITDRDQTEIADIQCFPNSLQQYICLAFEQGRQNLGLF